MPDNLLTYYTLLDELDARQNDVLSQLDELNDRVEQLLRQFTQPPRSQASPPPERPAG